jgi:hypothetical protein
LKSLTESTDQYRKQEYLIFYSQKVNWINV